MACHFLDIRDPLVQDMLWRYLEPQDIRHDYTKADALRFVYDEVVAGNQWLVGDLAREVMLRVWLRNPQVIEPHIMGNGLYIRSVIAESLPLAWERGVEKVMVWSQYPAVGQILLRLGFACEGQFRRMHLVDGQLLDLNVYSLERPKDAPL